MGNGKEWKAGALPYIHAVSQKMLSMFGNERIYKNILQCFQNLEFFHKTQNQCNWMNVAPEKFFKHPSLRSGIVNRRISF